MLQKELLTALYPANTNFGIAFHKRKPQFRSLKRQVWTLLSQSEEDTAKYTILQIVSQLLLWIELDLFASPTSEHVFVSSWSTLFNILLHDTPLRATPNQGYVRRATKKSVRLNAAILYDLEAKRLDISKSYPIITEGQALGLDFYTLRRYGDVLGAGRSTTKSISLPSHVDQLKAFLESETILTRLAFKFAHDATDVLTMSSPTPFGANSDCYDDDDDDGSSSTMDC
ncbi:hypothetical protein BGW42_001307 [Actinomortierella wolfii]|nr:hypothetical protein BGW42_001307 [Actinomortierella wolfii]